MSVEDEKKPRKTPAKKAAAPKKTVAPKEAKAAPKTAKKAIAKSTNGTAAATADSKVPPTHAQIAEQAYHYFLERGGQHGFHEHDWFRAEQELWSKRT